MNHIISNLDDVIDSRDVIARIEELASARDDGPLNWEAARELAALVALRYDGVDYAEDWEYGVTLIRDTYFVEYAQELADDLGAIPDEYRWPTSCIDWEWAARELRYDYTAVDFDGVRYWVR